MSLPDAVDAAGFIGVSIGLGSNARWQELERSGKQTALNMGYEMVCHDRAALRPALMARLEKDGTSFGQGRSHGSPLGVLWSWMRNRRTLAPTDPLAREFFSVFP